MLVMAELNNREYPELIVETNSMPNDRRNSLSPEGQKLQPMAFTIHFADKKDTASTKQLSECFNKYASGHRRNPSYPSVEHSKDSKSSANLVRAVGLSPLPVRKCLINSRRAGYHSEGYFSSDQEEDTKIRNDFFVKKFKNLDKVQRTTNLAQEKKIMSQQQSSLAQVERDQFGDFLEDSPNTNTASPVVQRRACIMGETWPNSDDEENDDEEEEEEDGVEGEEVSNDTVSEAGTYTIEKDAPCAEVVKARLEVEQVVAGSSTTGLVERKQDGSFKMSTYKNSPNWIKEWATHVVNHNTGGLEQPKSKDLPPIAVQNTSVAGGSVTLTRIPSPPGFLPPSGRKTHPSPQHVRKIHSPLNMQAFLSHESLSNMDAGAGERHSDSSLETECFLRTTESVVTAMQARVGASLDSGGESDVDTSHSYKAKHGGGPRSDSSSDTDHRGQAKDQTSGQNATPPVMRYNRAFSLRRARLDDPNEKKKPITEAASVCKTKKIFEPTKSNLVKNNKPKNAKPENTFSRTETGRMSIRGSKTVSQPPVVQKCNAAKKDGKKGSPGGRSNSTLSSKEVEFQNWKRRKSYDPMKAAAEGKKKEAAKKAVMSTSATQSSFAIPEASPSHQNPVLRSASFHGTGGLTPKYVSSEDEMTLSADEDSPVSGYPPLSVASPSKVMLEGVLGGSRASLYSAASSSSLRARNKMEALDNLVMAAVCGISNKLRASSSTLLRKLRVLYDEDPDRSERLSAVIEQLQNSACGSPQTRSPSKELSSTLKNLKKLENVIKVLDEVLFEEEEFEVEVDEY